MFRCSTSNCVHGNTGERREKRKSTYCQLLYASSFSFVVVALHFRASFSQNVVAKCSSLFLVANDSQKYKLFCVSARFCSWRKTEGGMPGHHFYIGHLVPVRNIFLCIILFRVAFPAKCKVTNKIAKHSQFWRVPPPKEFKSVQNKEHTLIYTMQVYFCALAISRENSFSFERKVSQFSAYFECKCCGFIFLFSGRACIFVLSQ